MHYKCEQQRPSRAPIYVNHWTCTRVHARLRASFFSRPRMFLTYFLAHHKRSHIRYCFISDKASGFCSRAAIAAAIFSLSACLYGAMESENQTYVS